MREYSRGMSAQRLPLDACQHLRLLDQFDQLTLGQLHLLRGRIVVERPLRMLTTWFR
jgi:hypothetical protein